MFYNTPGTLVVWASTKMHSIWQHNLRVQNARAQPCKTHRKFIDSMCSLNLFNHRMEVNECDRDDHSMLEKVIACYLLSALVRHTFVEWFINTQNFTDQNHWPKQWFICYTQIPTKHEWEKPHRPLHKNFPKLKHICCKCKSKSKSKKRRYQKKKEQLKKEQFFNVFLFVWPRS